MRNGILLMGVLAALSACTSVKSYAISDPETAKDGAIGIVHASSVGFTLFFDTIELKRSDIEQVVNELVVREAQSMAGTRIEVIDASTSRRQGIYRLVAAPILINIFGLTFTEVTAVVHP